MSDLVVNDKGVLKPQNIEEAFRVAKAFAMSGILPVRFKTTESVFAAMQFALELGLPPLTGMRQIAVVNGTPAIFGDLPLSVCYASGKLEWIKEYLIDKNKVKICSDNKNLGTEPWGSVTIVKRKGDPEVCERFFSMDDAKKAGIIKNVWITYPGRMLTYRSRSMALKDKFPDALNGISIAEYDHNVVAEEIELSPAKKTRLVASESSNSLNEIYSKNDAIEEVLTAETVINEETGEINGPR